MNKDLLIKYISGQTSKQENGEIERWIMQDGLHLKYYTQLKDICVISKFPNTEANQEQMLIAKKIVEHNNKSRKFRIAYFSISAVILIGLIINVILLTTQRNNHNTLLPEHRIAINDTPQHYLHTIYTNKGVKGDVTLPDGSTVKLNSDTKIIFPDKFLGSSREVFISGEAFFNVVPNPDTPMIVTVNKNLIIKVLGTQFNVRSYNNENNASATLYSGKIDILQKNKAGEAVLVAKINPKESFVLKEKENIKNTYNADTIKVNAWTRGNLMFELTPMSEVFNELERWYGAQFNVKDKSIYNQYLSADFKNESLIQIMEIIKFCTKTEYKIEDGNKVVIY